MRLGAGCALLRRLSALDGLGGRGTLGGRVCRRLGLRRRRLGLRRRRLPLREREQRVAHLAGLGAAVRLPGETGSGPTKDERRKVYVDSLREAEEYFRSSRVCLPKATVERIEKLMRDLNDAGLSYSIAQGQPDHPETYKMWIEAWKSCRGPLLDALRTIEDECRALLEGKEPGTD